MSINRETVLRATLRLWRRSAHVYGQADCLLSVADYGRELTGVDIGGRWRGTYRTEAAATAIIDAAGGAVALLGGALLAGGFVPVAAAERGDPIVATLLGRDFGGLHLGDGRAAFRLERGLLELRVASTQIIGAWRCPRQ